MRLLRLIENNATLPRYKLFSAALISGVTSTGVLALVNTAAREISDSGYDSVDWVLAGIFLVAMIGYYFSDRYLLNRFAIAVEGALDRVRSRLLNGVRCADFEKLEQRKPTDVATVVAGDVAVISQISQFLCTGLRSLVLLAVLTAYLAWLSVPALIVVAGVIVVAAIVYMKRGTHLETLFKRLHTVETILGERISDLLDGRKEVRMWRARADDLGAAFADTSERVRRARTRTQKYGFDQFVFGESVFFFVLAAVVFGMPSVIGGMENELVQVATTVLFLMGPVGMFVQFMTIVAEADAAAGRLMGLEEELDRMRDKDAEQPGPPFDPEFSEIRVSDVVYAYQAEIDEHAFTVGPIDAVFKRGDINFITGGNGSGKSTLVRVLCGLYRSQQGHVSVDGRPVIANAVQPYRDMISTVFSDYHLFQGACGMDGVDMERVYSLLVAMKLDHVTGFHDGKFDTIKLSAGQRKRLALVIALLEDRPILVLDEWASDQDPGFRRIFYREILPGLKEQGKTVIAVTHDDHYFDAADRRIHMEEGRITEDSLNARSGEGHP